MCAYEMMSHTTFTLDKVTVVISIQTTLEPSTGASVDLKDSYFDLGHSDRSIQAVFVLQTLKHAEHKQPKSWHIFNKCRGNCKCDLVVMTSQM